jgi:hypothetical protein
MNLRSFSFALGLSVFLLPGVASAATCNWPDGMDPSVPVDGGRGVSDWRAHYDFATKGKGAAAAGALSGPRVAAIKACQDPAAFARLYADLSILIGAYGRAHAGWRDGGDPTAPQDDGGRGITSWTAHEQYVLAGVGMSNADKLVGDRMMALATALPKDIYARLYADFSIVVANAARAR